VELEVNGERSATHAAQRVTQSDLFRSYRSGHRTIRIDRRTRDQFVRLAFSARRLQCRRIQSSYSFASHFCRQQSRTQNDPRNRADFHERVPTLDIVSRISFRNAKLLRRLHAFSKAATRFHRFENHIRRRVESTAERTHSSCRQCFAKERENGRAVEHSRLKHESFVFRFGEFVELVVSVDNRRLIRRDRVRTGLQRGF